MSCLLLTDYNSFLASEIFKILIEDRITTHIERINNNIHIVTMHREDLVMAGNSIQTCKAKYNVVKLSYAARGSFQIIRGTGYGNCIVRKLNKTDNPELNFMSEDLYISLSFLKHYEPVDSSNTRYLNQYHAPIINPLNNIFKH